MNKQGDNFSAMTNIIADKLQTIKPIKTTKSYKIYECPVFGNSETPVSNPPKTKKKKYITLHDNGLGLLIIGLFDSKAEAIAFTK